MDDNDTGVVTADDFPNLRALPALREKATVGPWRIAEEVDGIRAGRPTVVRAPDAEHGWMSKRIVTVDQTRSHDDEHAEANVAVIVAAVNAVPDVERLLERYDAQAKEIAALRGEGLSLNETLRERTRRRIQERRLAVSTPDTEEGT